MEARVVAHGVYVAPVSASSRFLPGGWTERARSFAVDGVRARCLAPADLAVTKLAAGHLLAFETVSVVFALGFADPKLVRAEIARIGDVPRRTTLLARLQIVLESVGR